MMPIGTLHMSRAMLLLLLMCCAPWVRGDAEPAGVVLAASGAVTAQRGGEAPRPLTRRSPFYAGDVLVTATDASAQLRFSDGALLALRADSELRIDAYQYDVAKSDAEGNHSASSLLKGGLRTITGVIGKQDPEAYKVTTPVATIGVRGTHYEAVLQDDGLAVAAWSGKIVVANAVGSIALGVDQAYAYASIGKRGEAPRGLMQAPPILRQGFAPAPNRSSPQPTTIQPRPAAGTDALAPPPLNETADAPTALPPRQPIGTEPGMSPCQTCNPPQQTFVDTVDKLPLTQDLRFTNTEWSLLKTTPRLGMMVMGAPNSGGPGGDGGIWGGQALLSLNPASPIIVDRGVSPDDPSFLTGPIQKVFRQGSAALMVGPANAYNVIWGEWNGQIGPGPIRVQTDAKNGSVIDPLYKPVWFTVATPTDPAVLAARTGNVNYSVTHAFIGNGSGGPIAGFNFAANINFTTGAVTGGTMNIVNADTWAINFTGSLANGFFSLPPAGLTGTVNGAGAVQGGISALVIGNAGQALGGGFDLEKVGNPGVHVEGLFIVECAGPPAC